MFVAQELATLLNREVGVNFMRANDERNFKFNLLSFKTIFSDWFQTMRDKTDMVNARDHVISCFRNDNLRIFPLATKLEQLATKVDVEELWAHVMRLQEEETSHVSRGASRGGGYMGGDWARVHDDILLTKIPMHPSSGETVSP